MRITYVDGICQLTHFQTDSSGKDHVMVEWSIGCNPFRQEIRNVQDWMGLFTEVVRILEWEQVLASLLRCMQRGGPKAKIHDILQDLRLRGPSCPSVPTLFEAAVHDFLRRVQDPSLLSGPIKSEANENPSQGHK